MSAIESPQVSVVMPAFNASATVERAVHSLQRQTLRNIEIIVVNDGSTDDTCQVLTQLSAGDNRIRVMDRSHNEGLVHSLQEGIAAARAPLIARLDADDQAHALRLERQVEVFKDSEVVLSSTAYRRVRSDGTNIRESRPPIHHAAMAAALLDGNRVCHSSVMFRRDAFNLVGGYLHDWYPVEDYDLWLRLLQVGRYQGIDEVLTDYLENTEGVSARHEDLQSSRLKQRRRDYRLAVYGRDASPTASPRFARLARRQLGRDLTKRGIRRDGLDAELYRMVMGGPSCATARRARALAAPLLVWRGRRDSTSR